MVNLTRGRGVQNLKKIPHWINGRPIMYNTMHYIQRKKKNVLKK